MKEKMNDNVAVMRHANAGSSMSPDEEFICRDLTNQLAKKIAQWKRVYVFHSPLMRAFVTAKVVTSELIKCGFLVSINEREWLGCEEFELEEKKIRQQLEVLTIENGDQDFFLLLISHQPDIQTFLRRRNDVYNCSIIARNFEVHRY